jgi:hypothetical protein
MPLIGVRQARPESCAARADCKSHHLKRLSAIRIADM